MSPPASAAPAPVTFDRTITLALTGASGMPYGLRLLECLLAAPVRVQLLYSSAAQIVARQECDVLLPAQPREAARTLGDRYGAREGQLTAYAREDWMSPVASGSNPGDAMAICPCTMGTLGAIAAGRDLNDFGPGDAASFTAEMHWAEMLAGLLTAAEGAGSVLTFEEIVQSINAKMAELSKPPLDICAEQLAAIREKAADLIDHWHTLPEDGKIRLEFA